MQPEQTEAPTPAQQNQKLHQEHPAEKVFLEDHQEVQAEEAAFLEDKRNVKIIEPSENIYSLPEGSIDILTLRKISNKSL